MKTTIAIACLSLIAVTSHAQQELEISTYVPQPPLGTAMETPAQKQYRREIGEQKARAKIEAFDLFAVAISSASSDTMLADKSTWWTLERGEAFPFLGFDGPLAFVRVGGTYMTIPKSMVVVVRLSEHPEVAQLYANLMAQFKSDLANDRRQAALDESAARLKTIEEQQRRLLMQQQFMERRMLDLVRPMGR